MKAKCKIVIEYESEISEDPDVYEGAATPEARLEKEREYLLETDRDYLMQTLSCIAYTLDVEITPSDPGMEPDQGE